MTMSIPGLIGGILAGLLVTIMVTVIWPKNRLRWARPIVSAGLGVGIAYALMTLIK